jgi:dephospho-CoA kinase
MLKIGVTGGIGSGKTTLCKEWEKEGVFVLYADDFAKHLMQEDPELRKKIMKTFGKEAYHDDGTLNRGFLAWEAFEKNRVDELNALVHPVLWDRTEKLAKQKEKQGVDIFVKEAAILLNHGRPRDLDFVVIVLADKAKRIRRTHKRDETSFEQIKGRMAEQPDFDSYIPIADFIVMNNGTLGELRTKARQLLRKIKQIE